MTQGRTGLTDRPDWKQAIELVMQSGQPPADGLHVTALLEMSGYSDQRARAQFGFRDLFEMGEALFHQIQRRIATRAIPMPDPLPWYRWIGLGFIYFLRGIMFAAPMVVSVFAMLLLRFSLWSYEAFGPEPATGIALATMGSFLVTGGFTQAIARRGLFYVSQKEFSLARRTSVRLMFTGLALSVLLGVFVLALNFVIPFFPQRLLIFAAPYYFFLCLLWLTITILYMLRQELIFTAITGAGIVAVWYLFAHKRWLGIVEAQLVGLGLSTAVSLAVAYWLFRRYEQRPDAGVGDAELPRWSQVARALVPYFLFGILYFAFLFLDRLLAWSVPSEVHPYPIWFLGDYELGLDWAILTLVFPLGLLELIINVFVKRLEHWIARTPADEWHLFNQQFRRTYLAQQLVMVVVASVGAWLVWLALGPLQAFGWLDVRIFSSDVTFFVFWVGTIAYVFVSVGLLNCLLLFSLNDPWPAVRAVAIALVADLLVGFLLSRQVHYAWASVGLLAGSLVFAWVSMRQAIAMLGRLDYMLYRSY